MSHYNEREIPRRLLIGGLIVTGAGAIVARLAGAKLPWEGQGRPNAEPTPVTAQPVIPATPAAEDIVLPIQKEQARKQEFMNNATSMIVTFTDLVNYRINPSLYDAEEFRRRVTPESLGRELEAERETVFPPLLSTREFVMKRPGASVADKPTISGKMTYVYPTPPLGFDLHEYSVNIENLKPEDTPNAKGTELPTDQIVPAVRDILRNMPGRLTWDRTDKVDVAGRSIVRGFKASFDEGDLVVEVSMFSDRSLILKAQKRSNQPAPTLTPTK